MARWSVIFQNSSLIVCCLLIYVAIDFRPNVAALLPGQALLYLLYALIIVIAILANMTNLARATAIERDWVVEICHRDKNTLASMVDFFSSFVCKC